MKKEKILLLCGITFVIASWMGCSSPPDGIGYIVRVFSSGNTSGNLKPCG